MQVSPGRLLRAGAHWNVSGSILFGTSFQINRSLNRMEYDTTYVPINDVYYRRFFIPLLITTILFIGVFLVIRGAPGMELNAVQSLQSLQFGGGLVRRLFQQQRARS
jgi:hypothetical protein